MERFEGHDEEGNCVGDVGICYCQNCSLEKGSNVVRKLAEDLSEYGVGLDESDLYDMLNEYGGLLINLGVKIALFENIIGANQALEDIESLEILERGQDGLEAILGVEDIDIDTEELKDKYEEFVDIEIINEKVVQDEATEASDIFMEAVRKIAEDIKNKQGR